MVVVLRKASREASQAGGCRTVGGGAQRLRTLSQGQADRFLDNFPLNIDQL